MWYADQPDPFAIAGRCLIADVPPPPVKTSLEQVDLTATMRQKLLSLGLAESDVVACFVKANLYKPFDGRYSSETEEIRDVLASMGYEVPG